LIRYLANIKRLVDSLRYIVPYKTYYI